MSKTREAEVRKRLAGGYRALQHDHNDEIKKNEARSLCLFLTRLRISTASDNSLCMVN